MAFPADDGIFLSLVSMKLRNEYFSLRALCEDYDTDEKEVLARLASLHYRYDEGTNRIVRAE